MRSNVSLNVYGLVVFQRVWICWTCWNALGRVWTCLNVCVCECVHVSEGVEYVWVWMCLNVCECVYVFEYVWVWMCLNGVWICQASEKAFECVWMCSNVFECLHAFECVWMRLNVWVCLSVFGGIECVLNVFGCVSNDVFVSVWMCLDMYVFFWMCLDVFGLGLLSEAICIIASPQDTDIQPACRIYIDMLPWMVLTAHY